MSIEEAFLAAHRGHAPPWMWEDTAECSQCKDTRAYALAVLEEAVRHGTADSTVARLRARIGPQPHGEPPEPPQEEG